jgi:hypothetical protein
MWLVLRPHEVTLVMATLDEHLASESLAKLIVDIAGACPERS